MEKSLFAQVGLLLGLASLLGLPLLAGGNNYVLQVFVIGQDLGNPGSCMEHSCRVRFHFSGPCRFFWNGRLYLRTSQS